MAAPRHFLFRAKTCGGHVHVGIWAGTQNQADQQARHKLGELIMDPDDWAALRAMALHGIVAHPDSVKIEETP